MQDDVMNTCVHEIGHAVIYEALGIRVIKIAIDSQSGGKCYSKPRSHRNNKDLVQIGSRAGYFFDRIFLQNMEEQEVNFYSRIPVENMNYGENMNNGEVDPSFYFSDYPDLSDLPEIGSKKDEKQLNILLQVCRHINFKAVRAAINVLYNTSMPKGKKIMSGRKFRKIIRDNGGLYTYGYRLLKKSS